MKELPT